MPVNEKMRQFFRQREPVFFLQPCLVHQVSVYENHHARRVNESIRVPTPPQINECFNLQPELFQNQPFDVHPPAFDTTPCVPECVCRDPFQFVEPVIPDFNGWFFCIAHF